MNRTSYIDTPPQVRRWGCIYDGHYWRLHTFDRLAAVYGAARAQQIIGGKDPNTNADIAAWNRLCALGKKA